MKCKYILLTFALFFNGLRVKSQNYVHTLNNLAYQDLTNDQVIHGPDSIESGYYVSANFLFPAFGAMANFSADTTVPSFGAFVSRNGYVGVYESPSYTYTYVFHGYLNNLRKIDASSSISVVLIPNGSHSILKIQWKNMGIINHSDTEYVNFQIWFDEADKSVTYHYGPSRLQNGPSSKGAMGLLRAPNNFGSFTHATYLKGDANNPTQLEAYNPTSFGNLIYANNFPAEGTRITFKLLTSAVQPNALDKSNYAIYPNPFNESIKINCNGSFKWKLTSLTGKQIKSGIGMDDIEIHTEELANGMYKIKIEQLNQVGYEKLVK